MDDAVALDANVVGMFLRPLIGSPDGTAPTIWDSKEADVNDFGVNGTYLLYWDVRVGRMAVNDGPDGMQKVDSLIAEAGKRDLRLIIAFLDFWVYTGCSQKMRVWYGIPNEATFFFRDPRTKPDYKTWVSRVVQQINTPTGLTYQNDPVIIARGLLNEGNARPETLPLAWTAEMSA